MKKSTITNKTEQSETMRKREISSKHIKDFRKNDIKLTQAALSERLGFDFQAVGRYERMECSVSDRAAKAFMRISGYIEEYWLGETECKTVEDYDVECENAGLEEYTKEQARQERKCERTRMLLELCGFGYENLSDAKYDFIEYSEDSETKTEIISALEHHTPHKVTDYSNELFTGAVYFSDEELSDLLYTIRNSIGYSCFKKFIHR